jgi:uncharacterized protein
MIRTLFLAVALLFAAPALAQDYPALTGRVVDNADLLDPGQEAALTARLEALERASTRQLVIVTLPDLGGRSIEDYGVGLGRAWGIGKSEANNGVLLIVAVAERKMRIEVGYGLEGIMTDALSGRIIREVMTPRFREGDFAGGINAGADAIIEQLQAPPEAAEQRALEAARTEESGGSGGPSFLPLIFWVAVLGFILVPLLIHRMRGRKYRGRRGRRGPVVIWGPGLGSGGSGGGWSSGSSWGSSGGSSWGGGGGGGFSGGGGSFGGGGASGGW